MYEYFQSSNTSEPVMDRPIEEPAMEQAMEPDIP